MAKPHKKKANSNVLDGIESELAAAEAAVEALSENFAVWIQEDLERMTTEFEQASAAPDANEENIAEIFSICHNIKGQAGSFGYTLLTRVASSMCEHVRDAGNVSGASLKVIQGHLMTMKFIVDGEVEGDGGEVGEKLFAKLQDLAQQVA